MSRSARRARLAIPGLRPDIGDWHDDAALGYRRELGRRLRRKTSAGRKERRRKERIAAARLSGGR